MFSPRKPVDALALRETVSTTAYNSARERTFPNLDVCRHRSWNRSSSSPKHIRSLSRKERTALSNTFRSSLVETFTGRSKGCEPDSGFWARNHVIPFDWLRYRCMHASHTGAVSSAARPPWRRQNPRARLLHSCLPSENQPEPNHLPSCHPFV